MAQGRHQILWRASSQISSSLRYSFLLFWNNPDLIPLPEIYSSCRHSILATAYFDAYFAVELGEAENYIHSISGTLLYHGAYTPWMRRSTGRLCVDLSPSTILMDRPILPAVLPVPVPHIPIPLLSTQDSVIIESLTLDQYQEIINGISLWSSDSLLVNGHILSATG